MNSVLAFFTGFLLTIIIILIFGIIATYVQGVWELWDAIFGIQSPAI